MVRYGLIGKPLAHSFSQRYFSDKFAALGLADHRYDLFQLEDIGALDGLLREHPDLRGFNVTIPYKRSVMDLLHEVDPQAAAVGAVNTIAMQDGRRIGYNTDVHGFRSTLLPLLGTERPRALVLGSGGACRAVGFVLRELGIRFRVVSRSLERGDLTWDLIDPILLKACPLIINTTPLGTHPNVEELPDLPVHALGPRHLVYDLVYNPERTALLREAEQRGARIQNGLAMLHAQAEASWVIWNR
ncbi:MAG: shikimate dehydrogenase [Flavobacteriales bacterium]|jgi:shikimate dehydrogenase|nr:shikimate dehydrogenase [Flavobacteriales bacterium]